MPHPFSPIVDRFGTTGAARLAAGLGQGLVLGALWKAGQHKVWPATDPVTFSALAFLFLFAPLVWLQGLTHIPKMRLALWTLCVAFIAAGLGAYGAYRDVIKPDNVLPLPESPLYAFITVAFFIAQTLIVCAVADRRPIAAYQTYFDTAWKHGVQAVASVGFTIALWLLLNLGAQLFKLIGLDFLQTLIRNAWFAGPATGLAVAIAVHVTDVRPALVQGIRTLALTLLSWLLPLLTLIVAGFLVSLLATGLAPLWNTKFAAALLLSVTAALVILINAAYQDGLNTSAPVLRRAVQFSLILPAPLVAIATYALRLRVREYGWTGDRVIAFGCVIVAACYAIGYALAAVRTRTTAHYLERCNLATSVVAIGVIVAIFSPLADPARISVNSQMARLTSGKVTPEAFDYKYLRFSAGRYGKAALEKLAAGEVQVADVQERARRASQLINRGEAIVTTDALATRIKSMRPDQTVPQSFLDQNWSDPEHLHRALPCFSDENGTCEALRVDVDGDGTEELILFSDKEYPAPELYHQKDGTWRLVAALPQRLSCPDMRALLSAGEFALVPPVRAWRDFDIGGLKLPIDERPETQACPPK